MKRILSLLLCLALLPFPILRVRADDSDIFGSNIQPNILIFIDSSGSMDDTIPASPYDPATTYTCGACTYTAAWVYKTAKKGGYSKYSDTIADVQSAAARTALSNVGHWSGRISGSNVTLFTGNYLNYVASPFAVQEKKITIAKRVLTTLINNTDGVRFGLAKFTGNGTQGPGGATIIADVGSSKATLATAINNINPSGYTPLKGALYDMGQYYKGYVSGHPSPIQYECQPNFIIMMSDGLQNGFGDVRDEATLRRTQDHSNTFLGIQNVLVHTVGFAVAAGEADAANEVLQTAADNGGGTFYSTNNEGELETALEDAIRQIMAATFMFATPVVPSTSTTGVARTYLAAFQSDPSRPFWRGYLKAFNRREDGNVQTDANDIPDEACTLSFSDGTTKPCLAWEAGAVLNSISPGDRHIKVLNGTALEDISTSNLTTTALGVSTTAARDKIINFLKGFDVNDENLNGDTTDDRPWKLGDIFHSTPVLISPPLEPSTDSTYVAFRLANQSRTPILLAGANDGMLHAFRESDGRELWAFIPPNVLSNLKNLVTPSGEHQFYVDSSPIAADVKIGGNWKTIVIFGERRGGNTYYALDITDTENPAYLWSFTDSKITETWSEPVIGKVRMNPSAGKANNEMYVAIVGGGYDTAVNDAHGKAVLVIDVATGAKLWEYYNDGSGADRQYMNYSIPASPVGIDMNDDGYIDRVYVGDVGGQLWKFDLSTPARLTGGTSGTVNNSDWLGKRFFRAQTTDMHPTNGGEYYPSQAIYGAPNGAIAPDRKFWVYFGTGDRNHPNNTSSNRFYGIRDDQTGMTNGSAWTESDLSDATSAAPDLASTHGWYIRMASSEKVLTAPDIFNRVVYFTTFTSSTGSGACGSGGTGKLYGVQMLTSFSALDWNTGEARGTTATASDARWTTLGDSMPTGSSVSVTVDGDATNIAGGSDGKLFNRRAVRPDNMRRILYWREAY